MQRNVNVSVFCTQENVFRNLLPLRVPMTTLDQMDSLVALDLENGAKTTRFILHPPKAKFSIVSSCVVLRVDFLLILQELVIDALVQNAGEAPFLT